MSIYGEYYKMIQYIDIKHKSQKAFLADKRTNKEPVFCFKLTNEPIRNQHLVLDHKRTNQEPVFSF